MILTPSIQDSGIPRPVDGEARALRSSPHVCWFVRNAFEQGEIRALEFTRAGPASDVHRFYSVGPLLLVPLYGLGSAADGIDASILDAREKQTLPRLLREFERRQHDWEAVSRAQLGSGDIRKSIAVAPWSAVPTQEVNDHSLACITLLARIARQYQAPTLIDIGAASGTIGSAAINLGFSRCLLLEREPEECSTARLLLQVNQISDPGDCELVEAELSLSGHREARQVREEVRAFAAQSRGPVVAVANLGPWTMYQDSNAEAVDFLASLPQVKCIINGGYLPCPTPRHAKHSDEFFALVEKLSAKFDVETYTFLSSDQCTFHKVRNHGLIDGTRLLVAHRR